LLEDGSVAVPASVAARIYPTLERALAELDRAGVRAHPLVVDSVRLLGLAGQIAAKAGFARASETAGCDDAGAHLADGPLGVAAVAASLGVTPTWVRRLALTGVLRASKPGRDWVFAAADVAAFAEGRVRADALRP